MATKARPPTTPKEEHLTVRKQLERYLEDPTSFEELKRLLSLSPKQLEDELRHVERSAKHQGKKLAIEPPQCRDCEFVFKDRKRMQPPTRCPKCKSEWIEDPRFSLS